MKSAKCILLRGTGIVLRYYATHEQMMAAYREFLLAGVDVVHT
jgi:hypothetical protein